MWNLPLLWACAPGWLEVPEGREPALTALYTARPAGDGQEAVVLVVNSPLDCALLPDTDDPDALLAAQLRLQAALTREGAKAAALRLFRYADAAPTWEGLYPLYEDAGHHHNSTASPLSAGAMWYAVLEAEVEEDEGLYRTYTPLTLTYLDPASAPGWVRVDRAPEGRLIGQFSLEAAHASGGFDATDCGDETALFEYLNLVAPGGP